MTDFTLATTFSTAVLKCPVLDCEWQHEEVLDTTPLRPPGDGPFAVKGGVTRGVIMEWVRATEADLREHLESHGVLDYLRTIRDLRDQLDAIGEADRCG